MMYINPRTDGTIAKSTNIVEYPGIPGGKTAAWIIDPPSQAG